MEVIVFSLLIMLGGFIFMIGPRPKKWFKFWDIIFNIIGLLLAIAGLLVGMFL